MGPAKLRFRPGDVVLESQPFVAMLVGDAVNTHCHGCFRIMDTLTDSPIICAGCHAARYCLPCCVDDDAKSHARECQIEGLRRQRELGQSNLLRMMARLIIKLRSGEGEEGEEVVNSNKKRKFWDLLSHKDDFEESPRHVRELGCLHWALSGLLGPELVGGLAELSAIYGRLMINSFEVCGDQRHVAKAWGLYLAPSLVDHSCVPNASVSFNGSNIVIRALTNIPQNEEEEFDLAKHVTISYIDLMEHTDIRRSELLRRYFFLCECPRCLGIGNGPNAMGDPSTFVKIYGPLLSGRRPLEHEEDLLYSIRCQSCTGRPVYLGPPHALDESAVCGQCGAGVDEKTLEDYAEVYRHADAILEQDEEEEDGEEVTAEEVGECLRLMAGLFHPCHRLLVRACEFAFEDAAVKRGDLEVAAEYGAACIAAYRRYGGHCWRNIGLYEYKLGSVLSSLIARRRDRGGEADSEELERAREHLQCAVAVLTRTHGEGHSLVSRAQRLLDGVG